MIKGKRVIALIPARGGSKSVPYKNLKKLGKKILLAWPIDVAKKTREIDRIIVSTDDSRIKKAALKLGAEVVDRPKELAMDQSLVIDAIRYTIKKLRESGEKAEWMVLLEATSPFRHPEDIKGCLELLSSGQFDSSATFMPAKLNPHRAWKIHGSTPEIFIPGAIPWMPRQKLPVAHQLSGGVYAFHMDTLLKSEGPSVLHGRIGAVEVPAERSIDIDDELDFEYAELLIKRRGFRV